METQEDSLDLSYMKHLALSANDSRAPRQYKQTAYSFQQHLSSRTNARRAISDYGKLGNQPSFSLEVASKSLTLPATTCFTRPSDSHPHSVNHTKMAKPFSSQDVSWKTVPEQRDGVSSHAASEVGDTQPVSQSVYQEFLQDEKLDEEYSKAERAHGNEEPDMDTTQMTLMEGDTGHVDLFLGMDHIDRELEGGSDAQARDDQATEIGNSSPMQFEPFPESQRFKTTPAVEKGRSQPKHTDITTPIVPRNPFGQDDNNPSSIMALSQIFNATQPNPSPCDHLNRAGLDPFSDMPSPNIPIQPHRPNAKLFSETLLSSPSFQTDPAEPEHNYVSMKESQAERLNRIARHGPQLATVEEMTTGIISDVFQELESPIGRRIRQRRTEIEVRKQFEAITAPTRVSHRSSSKGIPSSPPPVQVSIALGNKIGLQIVSEGFYGEGDTDAGEDEETEVETEEEEMQIQTQPRGSQRSQIFGEEDKENFETGPLQSSHNALSNVLELENNIIPVSNGSHVAIMHTSPVESYANAGLGIHNNLSRQVSSTGEPTENSTTEITLGANPPVSHQLATIIGTDGDSPLDTDHKTQSPFSRPNEAIRSIHPSASLGSFNGTPGLNAENVMNGSSMVTQVLETPTQTTQYQTNYQTTIPETTFPTQKLSFAVSMTAKRHSTQHSEMVSDAEAEAEDYLPRSLPSKHFARFQPSRSQAPTKRNNVRLSHNTFSSPSGRRRRTLTDIASDESPRSALTEVRPEEIGLLTEDDRYIRSILPLDDSSPTKRRRGNNGNSIQTPSRPSASGLLDELAGFGASINKVPQIAQSDSEQRESSSQPPEYTTSYRPRSRTDHNDATVWDIESSPPKPTKDDGLPQPCSTPKSRPKKEDFSRKRKQYQTLEAVVIPSSSSRGDSRSVTTSSAAIPTDESSMARHSELDLADSNKQVETPNNVFAFFNGRPPGYYPAVCVGTIKHISGLRFKVHFEGAEEPEEIDDRGVKRLELNIGELVKVNHANAPKVPHYVVGFKHRQKQAADTTMPRITDVYGFSSVLLKQRITKLPPKGSRGPKTICVPISDVYLDKSLWSRLNDRSYSFNTEISHSFPWEHQSIDQSVVCRSFRTPRTPAVGLEKDRLFSGMAFALSYTGNEKTRQEIETALSENGGWILREGFDELFEPLPWLSLDSSKPEASKNEESLILTGDAAHTGFTCLITDQHSRRPKYMQALALNLPCLAGQWVHDCIETQTIVDWHPYLLAAGSSIVLDGAVKSRTLSFYPPVTVALSETISMRLKIFNEQSILFVTGCEEAVVQQKKGAHKRKTLGQEAIQKRKAFSFLTFALGPQRVRCVPTLKDALDILSKQLDTMSSSEDRGSNAWDWLYVGDENAAVAARKALTKLGTAPKSSTQGRGRGRPQKISNAIRANEPSSSQVVNADSIGILDNEFLCQVLILGKLFKKK
ncbi:hypothetical protein FQN57_007261 [Myotisia sp. PD_48]|nr:hypothetical protein FQN57_007261 [Myotisia sp. PD_48]